MTKRNREDSTQERQDSDYDGAWKDALRFHLREFIERCFPSLGELIDWSCEPEWLDKEIGQIIGQGGHRNREVDLLFKVRLLDGRNQRIYCHLEIQASYEAEFTSRIDMYNAGLKWTFREPVLTLVILADLKPEWRPNEHHFALGGFGYDLRFPICKLLDRLNSDWAEEKSLVADVARAQIAALRTAGDPNGRFYQKTQIVRNLYRCGYTADDLRERFRLIDWLMHLPNNLSLKFEAELIAYEKELQMPYVTSVERIAEERGLEQGVERGREEGRGEGSVILVLRQLTRLFGVLPVEVERSVRELSFERIQVLGESLFDFQSLADLEKWLSARKE